MQSNQLSVQSLTDEAQILNKSIDWWENEILSLMAEIDNCESEELLTKNISRLKALVQKGKMEEENINQWLIKKSDLKNAKT